MTAPAVTITSTMHLPGLPTWDIDDGTLRIVNGSHVDSLGRQWTVAKHPDGEKGWTNTPGPRTNRDDRADGDGSYRSKSYRKERIITLSGTVWCPTPEVREQTEVELAAVCSDGGRLYTYRRTTDTFDQAVLVELDDEPLIDVITINRVDWSFRFAAPDPRKHDYRWQEPRAAPATDNAPGGGLDDSGGGLPEPLDPGVPNDPTLAQVANYGTAVASPVFILDGHGTPLPPVGILRDDTGDRLDYLATVAVGETVTINCDEFTARGVPPRSAFSSARGDVSSLVTVGASGWPVVAPQDTATFRMLGSGPSDSLTVALRSAWR